MTGYLFLGQSRTRLNNSTVNSRNADIFADVVRGAQACSPLRVRPLSPFIEIWSEKCTFSFTKWNGIFCECTVRKSIDNYFVYPDPYLRSAGGSYFNSRRLEKED